MGGDAEVETFVSAGAIHLFRTLALHDRVLLFTAAERELLITDATAAPRPLALLTHPAPAEAPASLVSFEISAVGDIAAFFATGPTPSRPTELVVFQHSNPANTPTWNLVLLIPISSVAVDLVAWSGRSLVLAQSAPPTGPLCALTPFDVSRFRQHEHDQVRLELTLWLCQLSSLLFAASSLQSAKLLFSHCRRYAALVVSGAATAVRLLMLPAPSVTTPPSTPPNPDVSVRVISLAHPCPVLAFSWAQHPGPHSNAVAPAVAFSFCADGVVRFWSHPAHSSSTFFMAYSLPRVFPLTSAHCWTVAFPALKITPDSLLGACDCPLQPAPTTGPAFNHPPRSSSHMLCSLEPDGTLLTWFVDGLASRPQHTASAILTSFLNKKVNRNIPFSALSVVNMSESTESSGSVGSSNSSDLLLAGAEVSQEPSISSLPVAAAVYCSGLDGVLTRLQLSLVVRSDDAHDPLRCQMRGHSAPVLQLSSHKSLPLVATVDSAGQLLIWLVCPNASTKLNYVAYLPFSVTKFVWGHGPSLVVAHAEDASSGYKAQQISFVHFPWPLQAENFDSLGATVHPLFASPPTQAESWLSLFCQTSQALASTEPATMPSSTLAFGVTVSGGMSVACVTATPIRAPSTGTTSRRPSTARPSVSQQDQAAPALSYNCIAQTVMNNHPLLESRLSALCATPTSSSVFVAAATIDTCAIHLLEIRLHSFGGSVFQASDLDVLRLAVIPMPAAYVGPVVSLAWHGASFPVAAAFAASPSGAPLPIAIFSCDVAAPAFTFSQQLHFPISSLPKDKVRSSPPISLSWLSVPPSLLLAATHGSDAAVFCATPGTAPTPPPPALLGSPHTDSTSRPLSWQPLISRTDHTRACTAVTWVSSPNSTRFDAGLPAVLFARGPRLGFLPTVTTAGLRLPLAASAPLEPVAGFHPRQLGALLLDGDFTAIQGALSHLLSSLSQHFQISGASAKPTQEVPDEDGAAGTGVSDDLDERLHSAPPLTWLPPVPLHILCSVSSSQKQQTLAPQAVLDSAALTQLQRLLSCVSVPGFHRDAHTDLLGVLETLLALCETADLDLPALRFLFAWRQFYWKHRNIKVSSHATLCSRDCVFALHSSSQSTLLNQCLRPYSELSWAILRPMCVAFWLKNPTDLVTLADNLASAQYRKKRDPNDCALLYLALGKRLALINLFSNFSSGKKVAEFLRRDFSTEATRTAALKNAYVLLGQQKFEMAAAFFLLGGSIADAITVCLSNLEDAHLALFVARIVLFTETTNLTASGQSNPFSQRAVVDATQAIERIFDQCAQSGADRGDGFLVSLCRTWAGDTVGAAQAIFSCLQFHFPSTTTPGSLHSGSPVDPALSSFFLFYRSLPLVKRALAQTTFPESDVTLLLLASAVSFSSTNLPSLALRRIDEIRAVLAASESKKTAEAALGPVAAPVPEIKAPPSLGFNLAGAFGSLTPATSMAPTPAPKVEPTTAVNATPTPVPVPPPVSAPAPAPTSTCASTCACTRGDADVRPV
eukprot:TRINITY_DN3623_c0_g1_i2.p1 TRINITY_DN3623_c0_g1~~TRINITY_DN3623_c0_g1_i2.p1  ORF type:complete len:1527 (-),score=308.60 TRINITY_DN3623_c0_g1_i2:136-4659(-)